MPLTEDSEVHGQTQESKQGYKNAFASGFIKPDDDYAYYLRFHLREGDGLQGVWFTQTLCDMTGYNCDELLKNWFYAEMIDPSDAEPSYQRRKRLIEGSNAYAVDTWTFRLLKKGNGSQWVMDRSRGDYDAERNLIGILGAARLATDDERRQAVAQGRPQPSQR